MAQRPISTVHSDGKSSGSKPSTPRGIQWFFGVGIDQYADFPNLNNAVKDVKDVKKALIEDYGLTAQNTITLFDKEADEESVIEVLDKLTDEVGEDDSLLIYYSGHGHLNKKTEMGFWIPHDAKREKTSRYLRNSTIRDYLKAIQSRHTLLISDSCFSGSLFVRGANRSGAALQELESIPSRWAICSGRHDEEVNDGEPGKNSPFAQSILDVLRNNKNESLNVARLANRVVEQTRSNYEQLPEGSPLHGVGHKGGQYIFHRIAQEEKSWENCQRKDVIAIYSQYLRKFPDGRYAKTAMTRIEELEDETAWRKADKSDKISALHNYVLRYRTGKFVEEAKKKIALLENHQESLLTEARQKVDEKHDGVPISELKRREKEDKRNQQEERIWKHCVKEDLPKGYKRYLIAFPDGKYMNEAAVRIKETEDEIAWGISKSEGTIFAFVNYIKVFPNGKFALEAKEKISNLEKKEKERLAELERNSMEKAEAKRNAEKSEVKRIKKGQRLQEAFRRKTQSTIKDTNWNLEQDGWWYLTNKRGYQFVKLRPSTNILRVRIRNNKNRRTSEANSTGWIYEDDSSIVRNDLDLDEVLKQFVIEWGPNSDDKVREWPEFTGGFHKIGELRPPTEANSQRSSQSTILQGSESSTKRWVLFFINIVLTIIAGWATGFFIAEVLAGGNDTLGFYGAVPVWILGIVLTYKVWKNS